jgi:hypothetical protein
MTIKEKPAAYALDRKFGNQAVYIGDSSFSQYSFSLEVGGCGFDGT